MCVIQSGQVFQFIQIILEILIQYITLRNSESEYICSAKTLLRYTHRTRISVFGILHVLSG